MVTLAQWQSRSLLSCLSRVRFPHVTLCGQKLPQRADESKQLNLLGCQRVMLFLKKILAYAKRLLYICTMKNKHAQALGRLGGLAGTGKAKARKVTSAQARAAVMARWHKREVKKP
jgi:hypothetical protein